MHHNLLKVNLEMMTLNSKFPPAMYMYDASLNLDINLPVLQDF